MKKLIAAIVGSVLVIIGVLVVSFALYTDLPVVEKTGYSVYISSEIKDGDRVLVCDNDASLKFEPIDSDQKLVLLAKRSDIPLENDKPVVVSVMVDSCEEMTLNGGSARITATAEETGREITIKVKQPHQSWYAYMLLIGAVLILVGLAVFLI